MIFSENRFTLFGIKRTCRRKLAPLLTVRCRRDSRCNAWSRISELVEA